jgi:hypothetical protein
MKLPDNIKIYGNRLYRGECLSEEIEQATFFNRIRQAHPKTYGRIAYHPKNEGKRTHGGAYISMDYALGMSKGASDIIIPGNPAFVCELKRRDHTKSKLEKDQLEYLEAAQACGAFACVALGADAAIEAFKDYLKEVAKNGKRKQRL